ncbi:Hint domain-containing protein [Psychromarinibacter sp. C21-152]|uniref:Hint domain-containing protein n=1 Tax=Psychromarinibacter sediminicola TaxID=3033385 RepID=A0AAE3NVI9_9RHOB|nr:Hint domain-containing protein [Psychromarinibacter sediminicola]MDF0601412.1 Hint domain-containing protein [Psychromarinibacter sediminicola]
MRPPRAGCFEAGATILTPEGAREVAGLREGDLLVTAGQGALPVRWVETCALSEMGPRRRSALVPLRIAPGALGPARPRGALILASDQWVRVGGGPVARLLGRGRLILPARSLLGLDGVAPARTDGTVRYTRLLLDRDATVFVNGVALDVAMFRSGTDGAA